jgi:hypothetical protein
MIGALRQRPLADVGPLKAFPQHTLPLARA